MAVLSSDKTVAGAERKHPRSASAHSEALTFYVFVSPWIIGLLLFMIGPIVASLVLSFTQYDVVTPAKFAGLANYKEMLSDRLVSVALFNTLFYTFFYVPSNIIIALAMALLLNQKIKGMPLYRTIFYLPTIVPMVANCVLWIWLLQPRWGLINYVLGLVGVRGPAWLASVQWAKPALVMMSLWGSGGAMIIFLAALQDVPESLYEAATIDGAGTWRKFRHITLPLITPTTFFLLVMGMIGAFQIFETAYIMTGGGPVDATLMYILYLFRQGFLYLHMGYACAMAWLLFLIIVAFTVVQFRVAPRWVHYER